MTTMVTIIVPVYNVESYIADTLDSILDQSFTNFSVIIVNDGSTDHTTEIVEKYALRDKRLKILNKENGGVSSARNYALNHINSRYFTFVDGDDTINKAYLQRLVSIAEVTKVDVVSSQVKMVRSFSEAVVSQYADAVILNGTTAVEELLYDLSIKNHACAKLYRSNVLHKLRFDTSIIVGEDMEYVFRALRLSSQVAVTREELYFYLQRQFSAMNTKFSPRRADSYFAARKIAETPGLSDEEMSAAKTKLFTEAFSILNLIYFDQSLYEYIFKSCTESVNELARTVFANPKTRARQRVHAGLSIINIKLALYFCKIRGKVGRIKRALTRQLLI